MFFDILFRHRVAVLVIAATTLLIAALGLSELTISPDNRVFYGQDNPFYRDYLRFESEFTTNDNILFVLAAPYAISEGQFPKAIKWVTNRASALDHVIRVDSLANYPHPTSSGNTVNVESLLDWACPSAEPCNPALKSQLAEPHLVNRLVSPAQTATGVLATVSVERGAVGEIEALHAQAQSLVASFEANFVEFEAVFTGGVPMMAAFAKATRDDLGTLIPIALILVSLLLVAVLGSLRLAGVVVALGIASIVVTLGFAGWGGHTLNTATSIVPLIVFTLVVTSSMHIAVHFSRNLEPDSDRARTIGQARASLTSSMTPILLSAGTSAVSLASLWFVDSPPLRQLGLFSAAGVSIGCLFTIAVLPILFIYVKRARSTTLNRLIQYCVNMYAHRLERGRDLVLLSSACLGVFALGILRLQVNDDFVDFFDKEEPFRIQTDRATELLAGPNHLEIVVSNPGGTVFEPAFINYTSRLAATVRELPDVANVHAFSDVMEEVAQAFSGKSVLEADSSEELAQLFLVYELSLQMGQSNTDLINAAQDSARLSVLLKETSSAEIQTLEREIYGWHRSHDSEFELVATGENIPVAHLSYMNIRSMAIGIFISLAFTAAVVGLAFRSVRFALVALLSIVAPIFVGFGLWGWFTSEIGLAATAILALTIGVVVDDTAHYIYRFLDARQRLDLGAWPSAAYAWHRSGAAIVSTSIVLGVGLSLLLLSSFEINSTFGAVVCLIIGAALVFSFSILPRLTVWAAHERT